MSKTLRIDQDSCIGCGNCESVCPAVFKLSEQTGKSTLIAPAGPYPACAQEALEACPGEAISWREA